MVLVTIDPRDVPQETRRRILLEARRDGVKPSDLGVSRGFMYQMMKGLRPVPDSVVRRLLELVSDDALLRADPAFFSRYVEYTRLDMPVDRLLSFLVDYIKAHPASANLIISTLKAEAEKLGLTGKVYRVSLGDLERFEEYIMARVKSGDLARDTAGDRMRYLRQALEELDYTLTRSNLRTLIRRLQATRPGVADHTYKALKLFLREIVQDRDLLEAVPRPRINWRSPEAPSWSDICAVAGAMPYASPPRVFFLLLAATGLRVETAYNLPVKSIRGRLVWVWSIKHSKRTYFTYITPSLEEEIRAYLEYRQAYLDSTHKKSDRLFPYKPRKIRQAIYEAMEETLGHRFQLKQLRKRFAEHMSHHLSTLELQVLMGHAPREVVEKHYLLKDQLEDLQRKYDETLIKIHCL